MKHELQNRTTQANRPAPGADQTLAMLASEPPKELIERALNEYAQAELARFAGTLATARDLWRSHRELVEAPRMSARLKTALLSADGGRQFTSIDYGPADMEEARERLMADPHWRKMIMDDAHKSMGEAAAEPAQLPDWVVKTPEELDYTLAVWDQNGTIETVSVTREEYVHLKQALARMRGYVITKAA